MKVWTVEVHPKTTYSFKTNLGNLFLTDLFLFTFKQRCYIKFKPLKFSKVIYKDC